MFQNDYYKIILIDSTTGSTGNYAELDCEGIDFSTTFQVSDIADITTRKDAITKTISFKATKNNNLVFGNVSNFNRYVDETVALPFLFNFDITQDIDCQVYENSTLIFVGKLHFISTSRDAQGNINYDCDIEGYAIGLFQQIQNLLISNLDFTPFNHTYNIYNIQDSWSNIYYKNGIRTSGTTGEGYVYPCIDYGESITQDTSFDNKMDYRNFRPAFYLREYFNAIFNQSGLTDTYTYTVTGSTQFMDEFNKCIVPNNDSDFSYTVQPAILFEVVKNGTTQQFGVNNQSYYDKVNKRTEFNNLIGFNTVITGATGQTIINPALINGEKIVFNNRVNTTVTASVTFQCFQSSASNDAQFIFQCLYRDNDSEQFNNIGSVTRNYPKISGEQLNPTETLHLTLTNTFQAGSEMAFMIYIDSPSKNSYECLIYSADFSVGSDSATSQITINIGDDAILIGGNTQTINQTDFLTSYINMFNLYVYPDPNSPKNIIFIPYPDFYSNFTINKLINSSIDWSDKIDNNATITQTPVADLFDLYAFTFKDDTDYFSKIYKDKYGDTYGNLTLTGNTNGSNKSMDLIFGSTPVANYANRNVPFLWELDTNNLKKPKVTVPRILFYNGLVNCPTYEIGEISYSASTLSYYFSHIQPSNVSAYTFYQYAEANEYTLSSNGEFVDLTFGLPLEVYYTSGGDLSTYGSGKKTLYDRYYADYITELTDSNTKIIELSAYLTAQDIQTLDFRTPIFINSVLGHNYFKLLSVDYSSSSQPADIKLQTIYIKDVVVSPNGFDNVTTSGYVTKSGCGTGYTGESALYVVPAGKYHSMVSQADANLSATNELAASGQSFINSYGLCINTGTSFNLGYGTTPTVASAATATTYYTDSGNLGTGSTMFNQTTGYTRVSTGFYSDGTNFYETDTTSSIILTGLTSNISGLTYDTYLIDGTNQFLSCQSANDGVTELINYKISDPYPLLGTVVKDITGVLVPDGWYSDMFTAYKTVSGIITTIYSCSGVS